MQELATATLKSLTVIISVFYTTDDEGDGDVNNYNNNNKKNKLGWVESPAHSWGGDWWFRRTFLVLLQWLSFILNCPSVSCRFPKELEHSISNLLSVLLPSGYPPPPPCTPLSKIPLSLAQVIISSFIPAFLALHPDFSQHICLILLHGTLHLV